MAHCILCGARRFFLKVDQNNLCQGCQQKIKAKIDFVLESYKRVKESKVLKVKLALLPPLLAAIEELKPYEARGIPTADIDLDFRGIFSNTRDASLVEVTVDVHKEEGEEFRRAMEEYNTKYGNLPDEIYTMKSEDVAAYLRRTMEEYGRKGISTQAEMEKAIGERRPFVGPHARGVIEDGYYRIYVADDLIYDGKDNSFDCQWKRRQIYSEVQGMVAECIFQKDLATFRVEQEKAKKRGE